MDAFPKSRTRVQGRTKGRLLVEAVSAATGKSFIIDPRVHARVTILPDPKAVGFIRVSLPYLSSCAPVARWSE